MMRMSQISPPLGIISEVIQICLNARTLREGRLVQTWRCQDRHNQTVMSAASSIKSCRPWTMSSRLSPPRSTSVLPTVIHFVILDVPCLTPLVHAAPQLASPDDVYGGCLGETQEAEGDTDQGPSADISLCQVPTPRRTSSIVKRLQSAISGNVYIWQMVQLGFRANWSLPQVSQPGLVIPEKT